MNHQDIDTQSFRNKLEEDAYVLLDVRTPAEYNAGHLTGSVNIDFYHHDFESQIDELDKRMKYLVYCRSGNRSRQAMFLMRDLGFEEVYNLAGGIIAWHDQGHEIVK